MIIKENSKKTKALVYQEATRSFLFWYDPEGEGNYGSYGSSEIGLEEIKKFCNELVNDKKTELEFDATETNLRELNYLEPIEQNVLEGKKIVVTRDGGMYLRKGNMETNILQEQGILDHDDIDYLWRAAIDLKAKQTDRKNGIWETKIKNIHK